MDEMGAVQCQTPPECARTFQKLLPISGLLSGSALGDAQLCLVRAQERMHVPPGGGSRLWGGPCEVVTTWVSRKAGIALREQGPGPGGLGPNPHPQRSSLV